MLDTFEGMRFEYQRGLSNSFGVSHIMHLQPAQDNYGTYDFSANFHNGKVGGSARLMPPCVAAAVPDATRLVPCRSPLKLLAGSTVQHLLLSRTQTNGDVLARYILTATPNLTLQFQSQA